MTSAGHAQLQLINKFSDLKLTRSEQMAIIKAVLHEDKNITAMSQQEAAGVLESKVLLEEESFRLQHRLVKGAEHLEKLKPGTPEHDKATVLYNELERRLAECKKHTTSAQS